MIRIERILCPLDFSEFSERAFDYAQSLARHYRARLTLSHVIPCLFDSTYPAFSYPEMINDVVRDLRTHARKQIEEFARQRTRNGFAQDIAVCEGAVTDSILACAREHAADLIVMGTHGRHGFDRLLLGSVTEKVLRKSSCPVLAVRKPAHDFIEPFQPGDPVRLHKVLLATDFSRHSERALDYALSLQEEYQAELTLIHVVEEFPHAWDLSAVTGDVAQRLEEAIPARARDSGLVRSRIRVGRPYQEIVRFSLENAIDLIVLGVRGRNALNLAIFGSVAQRVLQQAPCPVLAVHL
jgi:nucleotide-binding universal stress UspA family protein